MILETLYVKSLVIAWSKYSVSKIRIWMVFMSFYAEWILSLRCMEISISFILVVQIFGMLVSYPRHSLSKIHEP